MNNRGMSLLNVLIAVAMMGLVSMNMLSLFKTSSDSQRLAAFREGATSTTSFLSDYLGDAENCTRTLLGSPTGTGIPLKSVIDSKSISELKTSSGASLVDFKNNKIASLRLGRLQNSDGDVIEHSSPNRLLAQIRIEFDNTNLVGGGVKPKNIPLLMSLNADGTQIVRCYAMSGGGKGDTDGKGGDGEESEEVLAILAPHVDPMNCGGQYLEVGSSFNMRGHSPRDLQHLTMADEKTRRDLIKKIPPSLFGPNAGTKEIAVGMTKIAVRAPAEEGVAWTNTADAKVETINGKRYYITPTMKNGSRRGGDPMSSCRGSNLSCVAGTLVPNEWDGGCGGGVDG